VRAYEAGTETCEQIAARFAVGVATLERWLRRQRLTGTLDPFAKAGGWTSPVDGELLRRLVAERPDRTTDELTRAYNQRAAAPARVPRSSNLRALRRFGYVFKKNGRGQPNSIGRASKPNGRSSTRGRPP
jgi:transposase